MRCPAALPMLLQARLSHSQNHKIIESLRLEKTSKIIWSNHPWWMGQDVLAQGAPVIWPWCCSALGTRATWQVHRSWLNSLEQFPVKWDSGGVGARAGVWWELLSYARVLQHPRALHPDLPQLWMNLISDGNWFVAGQTFLPLVLISLPYFTAFIMTFLDSASKLSLSFFKSHLYPPVLKLTPSLLTNLSLPWAE